MTSNQIYKPIVPLFDIDLTLVRGRGSTGGRGSFEYAIKKVFGVEVSMKNIIPHGMIDYQITKELLKAHGHGHIEITPEKRTALFEAMEEYFFEYQKNNKTEFEVLPGVLKLLERLSAEKYLIGVLTGNIEKIGRYKLQSSSLDKYISLGLFGNMAYKRSELSELAKKEVKKYFPDTNPKLVVIGDTPLDIEAAHEAGLSAIGVASGKNSMEELKAAGADAVIESLEKQDQFIALLEKVK